MLFNRSGIDAGVGPTCAYTARRESVPSASEREKRLAKAPPSAAGLQSSRASAHTGDSLGPASAPLTHLAGVHAHSRLLRDAIIVLHS